MNSTAKRVYGVIAIVVATYGVSRLVQAQTSPPEVEMPTWTFRDMPLQLGKWQGEDQRLDPEIAAATGASIIMDRVYRNETGSIVALHTAMFDNPAEGVIHSPINCYRRAGWQLRDEKREKVQVSEQMQFEVSVTMWEKEQEKVMVAYWYQLGDNVLLDRFDLGSNIRWRMAGQPKWPTLIKVMAQTQVTEPEDTRALLISFVDQVAQWLNQPEHQKYLERWPGV